MIELQKGYTIESDGTQYALKRKREALKKDTQEKYIAEDTIGYYGDLSQAIRGYTNKRILDFVANSEKQSLSAVQYELEQIKKEIQRYL